MPAEHRVDQVVERGVDAHVLLEVGLGRLVAGIVLLQSGVAVSVGFLGHLSVLGLGSGTTSSTTEPVRRPVQLTGLLVRACGYVPGLLRGRVVQALVGVLHPSSERVLELDAVALVDDEVSLSVMTLGLYSYGNFDSKNPASWAGLKLVFEFLVLTAARSAEARLAT